MAKQETISMMPTMSAFDHEVDIWEMYKGRLENFFVTIGMEDEVKKKSTLLNFISSKTYYLIHGLCAPKNPTELTYTQLDVLFKKHFTPPVLVFQERKRFFELQRNNESVQEWLIKVREVAVRCEYKEMLDDMVRDKFITGIGGKIFDRLSEEESTVTLDKVLMLAKKAELRSDNDVTVNYVTNRTNAQNYRRNPNTNGSKSTQRHRSKSKENYIKKTACRHCGFTNHKEAECNYKNVICNKCRQKGHMKSVCKAKYKTMNMIENTVDNEGEMMSGGEFRNEQEDAKSGMRMQYNDNSSESGSVFAIQNKISSNALKVDLEIFGVGFSFMIDSGAAISAIPYEMFVKYCDTKLLRADRSVITGYSGERLSVMGCISPTVYYNGIKKNFKFLIIKGGQIAVLGRNFFNEFNVKLIRLNNINCNETSVKSLVTRYSDLFGSQIGKLRGIKVKLDLIDHEEIIPRFMKARQVPFAFKDAVEKQLVELESEGIITRTENAQWGTPLVPIMKEDGKIRICADYRITINRYLKDTNYPIPRASDIFTKLQGCKYFSKIDLSRAYNQIELDEESRKLVTWSTHIGNFEMTRLPFGIKPATGIFQRELEKVLKGIPGVNNFLDDIVVAAPTMEEHNRRLEQLFQKLKEANLRLNKKKCIFGQDSIEFLGHIVSAKGIKKMNSNEAMLTARPPENVTELKSFCGLVNYYGRFIRNLATKMAPLYELLKKGVKYEWSKECNLAFENMKKEVVSDVVLTHYEPSMPVTLTCDASSIGIGAVISHTYADGSERPIEFASRTLTSAERNYEVIQKEALAIVYGTKKFYQYLVGREFTLKTDHKPLVSIFGDKKGIPQMSASRLQRWAFHLSGFNFKIEHVRSEKNCADLLSRIPVNSSSKSTKEEASYLYLIKKNTNVMVDFEMLRKETRNDETLNNIIQAILSGDVKDLRDVKYKKYLRDRNELSVEEQILMRGHRVVVPQALRRRILNQVHETHLGMVKTKSILRSYVWWPGMDEEVENFIGSCDPCLAVLPNPPKAKTIPWETPSRPWSRLHIDYAGPFQNYHFLVIIDAFSKWIEVFKTRSATAEFTVNKLNECFARFGLPDHIVSDNGTTFTAHSFKEMMSGLGIKHSLTAPGYAQTNGAAENAVKTIKNAMRSALQDGCSEQLDQIVNKFLFDYRSVKHGTTGKTPWSNMLNYEPKVKLDLLKRTAWEENLKENGKTNQMDKFAERDRRFKVNDLVNIRTYKDPLHPKWTKARIAEVLGPRMYLCRFEEGQMIKRHVDQIRLRRIRVEEDCPVDQNTTSSCSKRYLGNEQRDRNLSLNPEFAIRYRVEEREDTSSEIQGRELRAREQIKKPTRYR